MAKSNFIQITTTVESVESARNISNALVKGGFVQCAQVIGPIESTFNWKGKIETSKEWMIIAKTTDAKFDIAEKCIKSLHTYETPEIIGVPIVKGSKEYLNWLNT